MQKQLLFVAILAVSFSFFSCKSKKITVQRPVSSPVEQAADEQLQDLQNDLPGSKVERVDEGLKVTFDSNILFELNSSYLTDEAHAQLKKLVDNMGEYGRIKVEGHTDNTGTDKYNKWLSERRAKSVKKYMESLGLAASAISTEGYGESRPIADNATPEGQAQNRRVEVIIGSGN